jgi:hypothetical protein
MNAERLAALNYMQMRSRYFLDIVAGRQRARDSPAAIESSQSLARVYAGAALAIDGGVPENPGALAVLMRATESETFRINTQDSAGGAGPKRLEYGRRVVAFYAAAAEALELAEMLT